MGFLRRMGGLLPALLFAWVATAQVEQVQFLANGSSWRWLKGTAEASAPDPTAWRSPDFDDVSWAEAPAPFFVGEALEGTQLDDLPGGYSSVFLRQHFTVKDPNDLRSLSLWVRCDDGFIAWINGQRVTSANAPAGEPAFNSVATAPANPDPAVFVQYSVNEPASVLHPGENILAVQVFNAALNDPDLVWDALVAGFVDAAPPVLVSQEPPAGTVMKTLASIEVNFSRSVTGVDAADLLLNGVPATNVVQITPGQFLFTFEPPPAGVIEVSFRAGHGIADRAAPPHPFAGPTWSYALDPNWRPPGVQISEFLADNQHGIRDDDGDRSDWIELSNPTAETVALKDWALTDDVTKPAKWRFPDSTIPPGGYLVVFASEKNRTNADAMLHTNFKLATGGEYLALLDPAGAVISEFAPTYPPQRADVSYGRANGEPASGGYFTTPTPGAANGLSGPGFAPEVVFSETSRTSVTNFPLTLALGPGDPNAVIRITRNNALPDESSEVYAGPIEITGSVQIRARAFAAGLLPGAPRSETFLRLSGAPATFKSDLPVLVIHNFGRGRPPVNSDQFAAVQVFDRVHGVTAPANRPVLASRAWISSRGSSTEGEPKVSLKLQFQDEFGLDLDRELLGLPADSDWILYAPNGFEPVLIHNPFMHQLSREIGRYSPGTRLVEVYLVTSGANGAVTQTSYNGVYVLEEKIKRGPGRVDVDRLDPQDSQAPAVTGGYIFKIDRLDPGDIGLSAAGQTIAHVYPKEPELKRPERAAQRTYLKNFFTQFGTALNGPSFADPVKGYAAYIDVDAWVDHHLLNILAMNVDALRLSSYFHKPRGGKLVFGPLWDFDRALGSTDGRDANPKVWMGSGGTEMFSYPWWSRLFRDPEFFQRYIDRWETLRHDQFSLPHLHALVDRFANEVRTAQPRERTRWGVVPRGGSYQGEVNRMKDWLSNHVAFVDRQFVRPPELLTPPGRFTNELMFALTVPTNTTVWYTLDGTDPRLRGGGISPVAVRYEADTRVRLTGNARLIARANNPAHNAAVGGQAPPLRSSWSGRIEATWFSQVPPLQLTEIMFHPLAPPAGSPYAADEFEFLEFRNAGAQPLGLPGFRLSGGVDFTFAATNDVTSLPPGGRVLLVRNRAAFLSRYPGATGIAGVFAGGLANDHNPLRLDGPLGEPVFSFIYDDSWQPLADGVGFSLVPADESSVSGDAGTAAAWRVSAHPGGSPGFPDDALAVTPRVRVNEVVTTGGTGGDAIELFNEEAVPADVGGWWLSDDFREPKKFQLPPGTSVPAGGYLVISESAFGGAFGLSRLGDEVFLFSASEDGTLTGYHHGFQFGAADESGSLGRQLTSDGREHFVHQRVPTLGTANAGPRASGLMISEIQYAPAIAGREDPALLEFVELRNLTRVTWPLASSLGAWQLRGAVEFEFPPDAALPPLGQLVVVGFDPRLNVPAADYFRAKYGIPVGVPMVGPWRGHLNNSGDSVRLQRPLNPGSELLSAAVLGALFVDVDVVAYQPSAPWPVLLPGGGFSLQRRWRLGFGSEPDNWFAAVPTPGALALDADADGLPDEWELAHELDPDSAVGANGAGGDPDGDGFSNAAEFAAGTDPVSAASALSVRAELTAGGVRLRFEAVAARGYTVWFREALAPGGWQVLKAFAPELESGWHEVVDVAASTPRFYRVSVP